jgi:hypothetical protein
MLLPRAVFAGGERTKVRWVKLESNSDRLSLFATATTAAQSFEVRRGKNPKTRAKHKTRFCLKVRLLLLTPLSLVVSLSSLPQRHVQ